MKRKLDKEHLESIKDLREQFTSNANTLGNITMPSPDTESTFQPPSWQECERLSVSLRVVFSLMLMTPSIVSLAVIWLLVNTSHKGLVSVLTQAEFVGSILKLEAARYNTQVLSPSLKSLNQLYDAVHKTASEVVLLQFTFLSGTKK